MDEIRTGLKRIPRWKLIVLVLGVPALGYHCGGVAGIAGAFLLAFTILFFIVIDALTEDLHTPPVNSRRVRPLFRVMAAVMSLPSMVMFFAKLSSVTDTGLMVKLGLAAGGFYFLYIALTGRTL